ncbi:MAG TPA: response regulator [Catalimonadaceae bacterium]|jgi:two-component system chemotaxis response regulator CheY|nr:response regulator [Catalimonadaceae bacterium]
MKVLVVDDEQDVKDLFLQQFRKEIKSGLITTLFAHSGDDALRILAEREQMDIILIMSDINMPGMTGFELLVKVKSTFPTLKVYMVSAYGDAANMEKARAFGADGFIPKPVDFESLKEKIFTNQI